MRSFRWIGGVNPALLVATAMLAAPALAAAAGDELILASRADGPLGVKGNGPSTGDSMSADGTRVAFTSRASNLLPEDPEPDLDVFVRDLVTDRLTLVSRGPGPNGANGTGSGGSLSADGRFVAFQSIDSFDPADQNAALDVYVRDLVTGSMTLVSRASGPAGAAGDRHSFPSTISADGRRVVFVSQATNLDPDDTDIIGDVYVRDLTTATTTLVSRSSGTGPKADRSSSVPVISGDGSVVVFHSAAANLAPDDPDGHRGNVFLRDLGSGATEIVSRAADGAPVTGGTAAVSHDGRTVAFDSNATAVDPDDLDGGDDVFVRDRQLGTTRLVSRANGPHGADADGISLGPAISATGRFVAFHAITFNLHPDDADQVFDVYVRDRVAGTTTLASRGSDPVRAKANAHSIWSAISADGLLAMFTSRATNLHPLDVDAGDDVYVRELGGARACDVFRISGQVGGGEPVRACF